MQDRVGLFSLFMCTWTWLGAGAGLDLWAVRGWPGQHHLSLGGAEGPWFARIPPHAVKVFPVYPVTNPATDPPFQDLPFHSLAACCLATFRKALSPRLIVNL